jgi:hypothetical protein
MSHAMTSYIRAGYPGLFIVSPEEARVEAAMKAVASDLKHALQIWSATEGLINAADGSVRNLQDPMELLVALHEIPEDTLLLLRDFHPFLDDPNPLLLRAMKDALREAMTTGSMAGWWGRARAIYAR